MENDIYFQESKIMYPNIEWKHVFNYEEKQLIDLENHVRHVDFIYE